MKLLDDYFKIQEDIYNYFDYEEDWVVIPLSDTREYFWFLKKDSVIFAKTLEDFKSGEYYENEIYTQRFLDQWVYRKKDYTMIIVDPHTDGNKFLSVFDNSKELKIENIK